MNVKNKHNDCKGFSLVELLVAVFVFSIAFTALYGVLVSSLVVLGQNKAKLGAVSLVQEQLEYVRSLPFNSVGVVLGNPSGAIPVTATTTLNGILYTRRTAVFWMDDPKDGLVSTTDTISTDYKQVKVEVSWVFRGDTKSVSAITTISPKGLETNVPGGIFKFTVFDVSGAPVPGATITIFKAGVLNVSRVVPDSGVWHEYGVATGTGYQITVTKPGYSTAKTYATSTTLTSPVPEHLTSIDDGINPISFQIDRVSSAHVYVYDAPASGSWTDTFADGSKLSAVSSMEVQGGDLVLTNTAGVYDTSGSATSTWIAPANVSEWDQFSWDDTQPASTTLAYRVYYDNGGVDTLIPDAELPGNSAGFSSSPVNLFGLNGPDGQTNYTKLKIGVVATTSDTATTSAVHDWTITYNTHVSRPNFAFNMRGLKDVGTDSGGAPVYKYNQDTATDASGVMATTSLEWDTYTISKVGYDVAGSCLSQPVYIAPDTDADMFVDLTLSVPHAILVHVKDVGGNDVPYARVRLYRAVAPAFDQTKIASGRCGDAFWNGRSQGTFALGNPYSIDVSAPPYVSTTTVTDVDVSGYSIVNVTAN